MGRDIFVCGQINILVYIIVALFGIGSWVAVNGLWVELPVIVNHLPEGWKLPSYLTVIIQIANIGPIIVTLLYVFAKDKVNERVIVYLLVIVGTAACLLLALFWDRTSVVAGEEHSTALLILQFFLATVDCTSSVVFLPFMALFKAQYMTAYFIGEGLSGLIPSVVALGQGVGSVKCENQSITNATTNITHFEIRPVYFDPVFPVEDFFFFLFAMMLTCGFAFTFLNYLPICKKEQSKSPYREETSSESSTLNGGTSYEMDDEKSSKYSNPSEAGNSSTSLMNGKKNKCLNICASDAVLQEKQNFTPMRTSTYIYLLSLTAWINALGNGVLPSIQTYSCKPYGDEAYHLAATLSNIANPCACFVAFFIPIKSNKVINFLVLIGSGFAAFILFLASGSPKPVLYAETSGQVLVVAAWVLNVFVMTFSKVTIASIFRLQGRKALLWCGAVTQVGSTIGAIIMYILVNVVQVYQNAETCPS